MNKQPSRRGFYQIDEIVNGRKSWKTASQAIWFLPTFNAWALGSLEYIGSNSRAITTFNGQGDNSPFQVASNQWNYWDDPKWIQINNGDIMLECVTGN